MKSKEAIRNTILGYTNEIWGTKRVERLDSLIQMMIDVLTNELYLAQNKLNDLDTTLLEKIAGRLTPEKYTAVRPAHTILQMKPNDPITLLTHGNTFTLQWIPDSFINNNDGIIFHPLTDMHLFNLKIDCLFYRNGLFSINTDSQKELILTTSTQSMDNSVWLGLDIDPEIENLQNLYFYLDFLNQSEIHELYDVLPYTKCYIGGKEIALKHGFPVHSKQFIIESDSDILDLYNDHYLTIDEIVNTKKLKAEIVPKELSLVIPSDKTEGLTPKYWIKFLFPAYFTTEHLSDMLMTVNAFPVSNKKLIEKTIIRDNLSGMFTLFSDPGEKLLAFESIIDNKGRRFLSERETGNNEMGTYHLEISNKVFIEEHDLIDYIEQLLDLIEDERAVFSGIDKEQITEVLATLTKAENGDLKKTDINNKTIGDDVTKLQINPYENTAAVNISYWVTFGNYIEGISKGKPFDADRTTKLEGLIALSLCEVYGAKEFTDIQDIMSIDRYIFTSKDRIVTEHNIRTFCESELGRAIDRVEIKLDGKISPKPKEGIVRVIKITLIPSVGYPDLLYKKGILKSLKTRLERRSPDDFIYDINIMDSLA